MGTRSDSSTRIGQAIRLGWRLVLATVLFYAVAVLYAGTAGASGTDVFLQPMIGTAVFAGVLVLPLLGAWLVSSRPASSGKVS